MFQSIRDCFTLSNGVKIPCVGFGTWQTPSGKEAQDSVKAALTVEVSAGQMYEDVRLAVNGCKEVAFMGKAGSMIPAAEDIAERILKMRRA